MKNQEKIKCLTDLVKMWRDTAQGLQEKLREAQSELAELREKELPKCNFSSDG